MRTLLTPRARPSAAQPADHLDAPAHKEMPKIWFWHAPGSGVFYDAGRVLSAPSKLCMLVKLLEQWARAPRGGDARRAKIIAHLEQLSKRMGVASHGALTDAINATAHARTSCERARIPNCQHGYFLMDHWDGIMADLGVALGYETLFYTASTWGSAQAIPRGELVDLRTLGARKEAREVLEGVSARLSLRDPTDPADERRQAPCAFLSHSFSAHSGRLGLRLGCPGHVSWTVRDVPWAERNCRRVKGGEAHDSLFM